MIQFIKDNIEVLSIEEQTEIFNAIHSRIDKFK